MFNSPAQDTIESHYSSEVPNRMVWRWLEFCYRLKCARHAIVITHSTAIVITCSTAS